MKMYIGVTDKEWYEILKEKKCNEVNFWRQRSSYFKALAPNDLFLFEREKISVN